MDQEWRGYHTRTLWTLILLGIAFSSAYYYFPVITGGDQAEGVIGVVFGLYICSHPAANLVDMLFFARRGGRWFSSSRSAVLWVALNVLVLLIGWTAIFAGTTRFVGRGD